MLYRMLGDLRNLSCEYKVDLFSLCNPFVYFSRKRFAKGKLYRLHEKFFIFPKIKLKIILKTIFLPKLFLRMLSISFLPIS
ncbi:predicted protein [Enterococcus gallinarum EG2]|nr:predicted protein [Enterococcus gallinarum EG2]